MEEVEGEADPEVETRHPYEDGVLKALGEVRVAGVPREVPVLRKHTHTHTHSCSFNNTRSHENSDGADVGNTEKEVLGAGRGGVNVP